jgi:hypothetical protein
LAVIQRSVFRDEGSLFDFSFLPQPSIVPPRVYARQHRRCGTPPPHRRQIKTRLQPRFLRSGSAANVTLTTPRTWPSSRGAAFATKDLSSISPSCHNLQSFHPWFTPAKRRRCGTPPPHHRQRKRGPEPRNPQLNPCHSAFRAKIKPRNP